MSDESLVMFIRQFGPHASMRHLNQGIKLLNAYLIRAQVREHLNACLFEFRGKVLERVEQYKAADPSSRPTKIEIGLPRFKDDKGVMVPIFLEPGEVENLGSYGALRATLERETGLYMAYRSKELRVSERASMVHGVILIASEAPLDGV